MIGMETSVLNGQHTKAPKNSLDTLPRPQASREPNGLPSAGKNLSNGLVLLTLKLLVASHILHRNTLPSSKALA